MVMDEQGVRPLLGGWVERCLRVHQFSSAPFSENSMR